MKKCLDQQELWLPVVGYEGLYEDSNLGRVKSLKYGKERILRPARSNSGYLYVNLCKDGKVKHCYVHRLVAESFIPNPLNLPCINHKDENPLNNKANNLEFCTYSYNNNYGTRTEKTCKPVLQYTLNGILVREWPSAIEAEHQGGFGHTCISCCCNNRLGFKTHKGYIWKYKEQP